MICSKPNLATVCTFINAVFMVDDDWECFVGPRHAHNFNNDRPAHQSKEKPVRIRFSESGYQATKSGLSLPCAEPRAMSEFYGFTSRGGGATGIGGSFARSEPQRLGSSRAASVNATRAPWMSPVSRRVSPSKACEVESFGSSRIASRAHAIASAYFFCRK